MLLILHESKTVVTEAVASISFPLFDAKLGNLCNDFHNCFPDDDNMNDLCDNHPETLLNICLHLDDNRSVRYWYHLGLKIGISGEILRSFKGPSEFSPSNAILEKIATLKPKLPLMDVETVLQEVEKWVPGISNVLSDLGNLRMEFKHNSHLII